MLHGFPHNAVRLQLHVLAYNIANFLRTLECSTAIHRFSTAPDISLRAADLPYVLERAEIPRHLESARAYLRALLEVRSIKAVGSRPSFPKDYGDRRLRPLRSTLVAALRLAEIA